MPTNAEAQIILYPLGFIFYIYLSMDLEKFLLSIYIQLRGKATTVIIFHLQRIVGRGNSYLYLSPDIGSSTNYSIYPLGFILYIHLNTELGEIFIFSSEEEL